MEVRMLNMEAMKIRESENGNPIIEGYFAKFNEFYEICSGWKEKISPGAFDECLASSDEIKVLWNHDSNIVLGSRSGSKSQLSLSNKRRCMAVKTALKFIYAAITLWILLFFIVMKSACMELWKSISRIRML